MRRLLAVTFFAGGAATPIGPVTAVDGVTGALLLSSQPYGPLPGGAFVGGVRR